MKKSFGLTLLMEVVRVTNVERVNKFGHFYNRGPSKPLKLLTLDFILYVHRHTDIYTFVSTHTHVHALTRKK